MKKRSKMSRKKSRKNFTRSAGVKSKNFGSGPMRGGIRL